MSKTLGAWKLPICSPQDRVQAGTRHDFGLTAENSGGKLLHIHQLNQTELAAFVIKE
jgi:hypothetical protein